MELVHCHIAKQAASLREIAGETIPLMLSEIVSKLMAKNAEDRYQSAWGLKTDLEECQAQLNRVGAISTFALGRNDNFDRFQIPQKLYGREREIARLLEAFERVSSPDNSQDNHRISRSEFILVTGYSGIGKSALVQELYKPITTKRGHFISGKFDQYQRNIPYSAVVSAFTDLVKQLLGEPEAILRQWRDRLLTALGTNGQVVIDVIPDVALIIGAQPSVLDLGASESQNRFNLVLQQFIQAFCSSEHPLVLFLDDLQWADLATLQLLEQLITENSQTEYLLLIGAYRDREVSGGHPLAIALDRLQGLGSHIERIVLPPLTLGQIEQLIAETLKSEAETVTGLAELVVHKTGGNPFFVNEFLKNLYSESLLTFDRTSDALGAWQWDLAQIEGMRFTDNVVELMTAQLRKLPQSLQTLLSLAACLGSEFNLDTLSFVEDRSPAEIFADLKIAIEKGFVMARSPLDRNLLIQDYQFAHDRIQQSAYTLIPESEQASMHLKIGRILLDRMPTAYRAEKLFDIVDHLNRGNELIEKGEERERLAQLNLQVGKKAIKAMAHKAAISYLEQGIFLLGKNGWSRDYETVLMLHAEAVKAAFLSADLERMECLTAVVQKNVKTPLDWVKVSALKIEAYGFQGRPLEALATGLEMLSQLGITFPQEPNQLDFARALEKTQKLLAGRQPSDLADLPKMSDPTSLAALSLLVKLSTVAFISAPHFHGLLVLKQLELSIAYGNAPASTVGYATYGAFVCRIFRDFETAYQYGQLAFQILSQMGNREFEATILMIVHSFVSHWKIHLRETLEPLQQAHIVGLQTGEFTYVGYALFDYCSHAYLVGKELSELSSEMQRYSSVLERIGQRSALSYLRAYQQAVLNLIGQAEFPCQLVGTVMDETEACTTLQTQNDLAGFWHLYTSKLPLCYLFEEFELALETSEAAKHFVASGRNGVAIPIQCFYDSLCRLALCPRLTSHLDLSPSSEQIERDTFLQQVAENQGMMKVWSQFAPMNYLHKFHLVEAERYRVLGEKLEALEFYDRAIAGAREHGYLQEEALANERAAKFYLDWGKEKIARIYLQEAHYCYLRWGATAKVRQLEANYPQLFKAEASASPRPLRTSLGTSGNTNKDALDLSTVMKSSQAIASEIMLENLLQTLMQVLLENAGAQTGCLLLHTPSGSGDFGAFAIAARSSTDVDSLPSPQSIHDAMPKSVLNYVARTREPVLLADAVKSGNFTQDVYIQAVQPLSILCYPLLNRGNLVGIVYLENNISTGAFTADRVELLQLLSGQAAIAIVNAQLYAKVRDSESILEQQVADRTAALQRANQELSRLANLDGLTQIANRRRFDEYLAIEWQRHLREQQPLALILIDIDYFKRYNDCYGHQGGDDCLIRVAQAMSKAIHRSTDLIARYGGEEFAVILPNTNTENSLLVAESLRRAIAALAIPHQNSDVSDYVTLSLGIASCIPTLDKSPESLIAKADEALYAAKHEGRDRAIAHHFL
ncbi:Serine/threonine protein kinase [Tumidithrix helvetica PCC 7403]|uniref:diguanylate cyclase domain-containing protein n=1 Tax=Tumidithrix helvetica TaxID=3457545 RepID=UPI003C9DE83C